MATDYPNPWLKPVDVATPPWLGPFPPEQHKLGPWLPIEVWMKANKPKKEEERENSPKGISRGNSLFLPFNATLAGVGPKMRQCAFLELSPRPIPDIEPPMPPYRSRTTTHGRNMAGARGLWRATGMKDGDFGKPIIAVANSFTQFVPGHVHLKDLGQLVAREIEAAGGVAKEFNTIAVDDGIAMGHDGMLYSLPSREVIADSVEYMANAHCADALVCISNCDKITPGMLMAALRLNIPAVFVSGGPMEAGKVKLSTGARTVDLIDAMVAAADDKVSDADVAVIERSACPTCGSCSGMFTANSMNCLTEALGLSLPGNGTVVATHADRRRLFVEAGHLIVDLARRYYEENDEGVLPRSIASFKAFENAMTLDISMGGSTNTVLHLLAAAHEAEIRRSPWRTSTGCRAGRRCCARSPRRWRTFMSRTCIAPAASWASSANSTAPGS